ncbi:MAG: hypothetical protein P8P28_05990 [Polaribacter sp.]|nr:hypothetical protein [Polaribacter sp.]MDC1104362.1 hypothetical protein [Polaribacter sp.]MDG1245344.1 hypothetical protein [Polaribacter sp.]MDG1321561.1 hypothetical protein [Polaribacter sp.]
MKKSTICERERIQLEKMNKFQLGNPYKKVGFTVTITSFVLIIAIKYIDNPVWLKPFLHGILLIGLLLISVSKEKIEDEYIDSLRSQSYRLAFILAIVYALLQPIVNVVVSYVLQQDNEYESFNYFQVLFFMLIVQLLFFWKLKKQH